MRPQFTPGITARCRTLSMLGSEEYSGNPMIAVSWPIVKSLSSYVAGSYTWVGLDYIGEPKVTSTSAHVRNAATIDMVGNIGRTCGSGPANSPKVPW